MEMKHTPGPWQAVKNGVCQSAVQASNGTWITHDAGEELSCNEAEANARLIAAAPELLEALQAMLNADLYADGEGIWRFDSSDTEDGQSAVSKASAAIAKATGARA